MKKKLLLLILNSSFLILNSFAQSGEWTWMKGDSSTNTTGVYGTQGIPAAANTPPGMYEAVEWTDHSGNFWLFSGLSASEQSDLWKYDPLVNEWTWVKGPGTGSQAGVYGTQGIPSPANNPGARAWGSPTWVDSVGNLWVFGGIGFNSVSGYVVLNDLWKYDVSSNEWAWMSGPDTGMYNAVYGTQGVFSATNNPGNRAESDAAWTDKNGNLWMFGGAIYAGYTGNFSIQGSAGDLWEYDVSLGQWAWIKGPQGLNAGGVYGSIGIPAITNNPGAREGYNKWTDANGDFWLFGGYNYSGGDKFNDLWRYNIATNMWTWMSGSNLPNGTATNATQCLASAEVMPSARHESRSSYIDACGDLWLMGGQSPSPNYTILNDLWKYDPAARKWTWVSGQNGGGTPVYNYGTEGVSSASNVPPGRMGHPGWSDKNGNFWLWGGFRESFSRENDLWKYVPDTSCGACVNVIPPIAAFSTSDTDFCANDCISFNDLSINATSWQWTFAGGTPAVSTDENPQSICYLSQGAFNVTLIASNSGSSDTLTFTNFINVSPAPPAPVITQAGTILYCSTDPSYISYQWYDSTMLIPGATDTFLVVSSGGNYNVQVSNANGCKTAAGISIVLGIQNYTSNNDLSLSPNPAREKFTIYDLRFTIGHMKIFNVLGKVCKQSEIANRKSEIEVDVSSLPSGVYFIQIVSENEHRTGKFVKE